MAYMVYGSYASLDGLHGFSYGDLYGSHGSYGSYGSHGSYGLWFTVCDLYGGLYGGLYGVYMVVYMGFILYGGLYWVLGVYTGLYGFLWGVPYTGIPPAKTEWFIMKNIIYKWMMYIYIYIYTGASFFPGKKDKVSPNHPHLVNEVIPIWDRYKEKCQDSLKKNL